MTAVRAIAQVGGTTHSFLSVLRAVRSDFSAATTGIAGRWQAPASEV